MGIKWVQILADPGQLEFAFIDIHKNNLFRFLSNWKVSSDEQTDYDFSIRERVLCKKKFNQEA